MNLLRVNKHLIGVDIDQTPKMDQQYYKITHALMQTSCDTLRTKVLNRIRTQDLSALCIQLHRIGGVEWSEVDQSDVMMAFHHNPMFTQEQFHTSLKAHEAGFLDKPASFLARINIEYEMCAKN